MPQAAQGPLDRAQTVLSWLVERWTISTPPPPWATALIIVVIAGAVAVPQVWITLRHAVTIIHEMGHVAMGWLFGRKVHGISLHTDTSGLTITAGKPRGFGVLMTFLAGYTAPPLLGLGLIWATTAGYGGAALTLLVLVLVLAFLLVRNAFGILTVIAALAAAGVVFWTANPHAVTAFTLAAGIFLVLAGFRTGFDLWALHARGEGESSDAAMAARHSPFPAMLWVLFFAAFAAVCAVQALVLLALGFGIDLRS